MKFVTKFFASLALALGLATSATAQFTLDEGVGDSDVKLDIKSTGPGSADLTFSGVKLVYLNRNPNIPGISSKPDASLKGSVWIVDIKVAPAEVAGAEVHLSGVGRGGYALLGNKVDSAKTKMVPLAETMTFPVTIKGKGGCAGFTLFPAKNGEAIPDVWVAKPGVQLKRGNGANDHTLVLCTDQAGIITKATPDQVRAYAPLYTEVTTVAKK